MIGKSTNTPASTPCMANDNAAVHGFRLLKVPLDSTRLSSNIPALLVFTTDTGNSKLAPAIGHDCAAVDSERTDGLVAIWGFPNSNPFCETLDSHQSHFPLKMDTSRNKETTQSTCPRRRE